MQHGSFVVAAFLNEKFNFGLLRLMLTQNPTINAIYCIASFAFLRSCEKSCVNVMQFKSH